MSIRKMSVITMMACLITVSSWLTIPATVPFTLQTFAVFCSLLLLRGKAGLTAIVLYIIMGCVGLPVFSGFQGGIGHIAGPTGGYIIGFIFTAFFYLLFEPLFAKFSRLRLPVLAGGLIICYLVGTIWFQVALGMGVTWKTFAEAASVCVLPYIIPDLIKLVLARIVSKRILKAFPDITKKVI